MVVAWTTNGVLMSFHTCTSLLTCFLSDWGGFVFCGLWEIPMPYQNQLSFSLSTKHPKIIFSLPDFPFSQKSLNPNSLFSFKWYYIVHGLEPTWEWKYKRRFWIFLCIYTIAIILSTVELSNGDLQSIHTMGFCPQNHDPCLVLLGSVATWVIQYLNYRSKLQS